MRKYREENVDKGSRICRHIISNRIGQFLNQLWDFALQDCGGAAGNE